MPLYFNIDDVGQFGRRNAGPQESPYPPWAGYLPNSSTDDNLKDFPSKYLKVEGAPEEEVVAEKTQAEKDETDSQADGQRELTAQQEAKAGLNSVLEPSAMSDRSTDRISIDYLNELLATVNAMLKAASDSANYAAYRGVVDAIPQNPPKSYPTALDDAEALLDTGAVDGPAGGTP